MTDDRSQPHPPIVGVGAALGEDRALYKRQREALRLAEEALEGVVGPGTVRLIVSTYLQHMRETET